MTGVSAATITGDTLTYQNETISAPITAADSSKPNIKNLVLTNTQVEINNNALSSLPWPSAVSLGGANGTQVGNNQLYGNLTTSIDKESTISIQTNGAATGIYSRTDSTDATNNAGSISIESTSTSSTNSAYGILAENLGNASHSTTAINLQDGSNINISTGSNATGILAEGPNTSIITEKNTQITLTNATNSANAMVGIKANSKKSTVINNDGDITLNGNDSSSIKTGIIVSAESSNVTNNGNITITGNNATAINIITANSNNLTSTGDISVTGTNAKGIIVETMTQSSNLQLGGNITIDGGNSTVGSAIQATAIGSVNYYDSNGTISVTGLSTATNRVSGMSILNTSSMTTVFKALNMNSSNSTGISAISDNTVGYMELNYMQGVINMTGDNTTGIYAENSSADSTIRMNAMLDIISTGGLNAQTQGIYGTSSAAGGKVFLNIGGIIDINGRLAQGIISNSDNGTASVSFGGQYLSAYSSDNLAGQSVLGISTTANGMDSYSYIEIYPSDHISATSYQGDATTISATATNGAHANIYIFGSDLISATSETGAVTAIKTKVTESGISLIEISDDVGLIQASGNGQAISATTQTGSNNITLGNTTVKGGTGATGGGIYMSSTTGEQQLISAANISAQNDQAIFGSSDASTTITNNNTVIGYTNFSGNGTVTFNNHADVVLQNFNGDNTKSTIINNFGTDGLYNNKGTIRFSEKNFDSTVTHAVFNVASFTNSGTINLTGKNPTGANNFVGDTFTINGNYVSDGGNIYLNTLLDDASSNNGQGTSDLLIVTGDVTTASDATKLFITPTANTANLGQLTVGNGIKVVEVQGTSSADAFKLGNPIVAGAYEYTLNQGQTDNNWYLSSYYKGNANGIIQYNPAMGAYLANQTAAVQMFQQSVFDRLISADGKNNDASKNLFWMRTKMTHGSYDSIHGNLSNRTRSYSLQMGGDLNVWILNNGGYFHLGIMAGHGDFEDTSKSDTTHTKAEGKVKGYTAGLYGTYFANQDTNLGLYVDLWSQMGWYRNEISGKAQQGTKKYNSTVWSNSIEVGYGIPLAISGDYQWLATPQAQFTYNSYDADNQRDRNNLYVSNNDASGLDTRLGVRFHARGIKEDLIEPFLEVNWLNTTAKNKLDFNGKSYKDGFAKDRFEAKVGLQGNINKQWSVSAQVGGQWGNNSFNNYQGQLNLNYKF